MQHKLSDTRWYIEEQILVIEKSYFSAQSAYAPWSRALQEKLIVAHLVKQFPAFYGGYRFITVLTRTHHCTLSLGR
jgi:hypothetical protein